MNDNQMIRLFVLALTLVTAGCHMEIDRAPEPFEALEAQPGASAARCHGPVAEDGADAVFVAPERGDDSAAGTFADPLGTIQAGLDLAGELGAGVVYVAAPADYEEDLEPRPNVVVRRGDDPASWRWCGPEAATTAVVLAASAADMAAMSGDGDFASDAIIPPTDRGGTPDK
ncbi:hypothetical protein [Haliangium sp.]|uniref:hypothetical protein n=1 Tax=Haliangium sp. TaxID=2663208 RepID=UPI003D11EA24